MKKVIVCSICALALALNACRSYDAIEQPVIDYQSQWRAEINQQAAPVNQDWWQQFSSPTLVDLIAQAEKNSPDLLISAERLRQAELQLNSAGASLFPSASLSASSSERRNRVYEQDWNRSESSSGNIGINYELDLWGKVAANIASSRYSYQATWFDQETSKISVTTAVANAYFQWLVLQERVATSNKNLAIASDIERIVKVRYQNGAATAADLARQRSSVLSMESSLVPLQAQVRQALNALAVLLGQSPQGFSLQAEALEDIQVPLINPGMPSELLVRRPDLAASEAQLFAANANVSAARAALLPSIGLSASAGVSSNALFSLSNASESLGWSTSLSQTIFDGGRLRNQVKISESRREELFESYRKAILTALSEVDSAQDSANTAQQQELLQQQMVEQAQRTLALTQVRYREGSDDVLSLLDAQRSLFQAEDSLLQLRATRLTSALNLYKALGGGWQSLNVQ